MRSSARAPVTGCRAVARSVNQQSAQPHHDSFTHRVLSFDERILGAERFVVYHFLDIPSLFILLLSPSR